MNPVGVAPRATRSRTTRPALAWSATLLIAAAASIGLLELVAPPATVERLVVDNRTSRLVNVGVAEDPRGPVLDVASIPPRRDATVFDVVDQGDRWVVIVRGAGRVVGRIVVTRDQLQGSDWRVVVRPDDLTV